MVILFIIVLQMFIKRNIQDKLNEALKKFPVVVLLGPRQVGKKTISKKIELPDGKNSIYLDLENAEDREKLKDISYFLHEYKNKCVIIDEAQLIPQLYSALRPLVDEHRVSARFLLLGSASPKLIKGVSESLAGRVAYLEQMPVSLSEASEYNISLKQHWYRGGFPEALLTETDIDFHQWMDNFIRAYIEKDIEYLFDTKLSSATLRNFWIMLANNNGGLFNAEKYANSLGVSVSTVKRYLNYFEAAYLVNNLQPWFVSAGKRLVKSNKVYIRDSGILHRLCRIHSFDNLFEHVLVGASWEGYVLEEIKRNLPSDLDLYFYRTHNGAEIDLILVKSITPIASIEIKFSNSPTASKGFYTAIEDIKTEKNYIITPSSETYSPKKNMIICSLINFIQLELPKFVHL
jgi:predicted AAA+ superfamily ATPase